MTLTHPDDPARELRRVVARCAALPLVRWQQPDADGTTPAERLHAACQAWADSAADVEGEPRRPVPRLRPHGFADQVTVLVHDLLRVDPTAAGRVAADLVALRRAL